MYILVNIFANAEDIRASPAETILQSRSILIVALISRGLIKHASGGAFACERVYVCARYVNLIDVKSTIERYVRARTYMGQGCPSDRSFDDARECVSDVQIVFRDMLLSIAKLYVHVHMCRICVCMCACT